MRECLWTPSARWGVRVCLALGTWICALAEPATGFEELALGRVTWQAFDGNVASRRVIEKLGFTIVGRQRGSHEHPHAPVRRQHEQRLTVVAPEHAGEAGHVEAHTLEYLATVHSIEPMLQRLHARAAQAAASTRTTVEHLGRRTAWTVGTVGAAALLLGLAVALMVFRNIARMSEERKRIAQDLFAIERDAAPIRAAAVAGIFDRALLAGRREDAVGTKRGDLLCTLCFVVRSEAPRIC